MSPRHAVRRVALRAALLAGTGTALLACPARAQQDTALSETIVQVVLQNGPAQVLPAYARDSVVLLPLRALLDLAEVRWVAERGGARIVATIGTARRPVIFDAEARQVRRGDTTRTTGGAAWHSADGELFVAASAAAWGLGTVARMSWADMQLTLTGTDHLPAVERLARDARRASLLAAAAPPPPAVPMALRRPFADGAVLDWYMSNSTTDPWRSATAQLGLGVELLGGDLEVSHQLQQSGSSPNATRWSWVTAWPERRWLRQVRLGDGVVTGPDARGMRGLVLTNSPFLRTADFGTDVLVGSLPRGWEVELYRQSQLAAYVAADSTGRYRLAVPLNYGPNPEDLVLYGPRGEIVRRSRTFSIPAERLPAGRFEYALSGGECLADPTCARVGDADVRYGISRRATVQGGVAYQDRADTGAGWFPYAVAAVGVTPALGVTVHGAVRGLLRARADFDPGPNLHLDAERTVFDTSGTALYAGRASGRTVTVADAYWRPPLWRGATYLQGSWFRREGAAGVSETHAATVSAMAGGIRVSAGLRRTRTRSSTDGTTRLSGIDASVQTVLQGPGRLLRTTFVRTELRTECPGEPFSCSYHVVRLAGTAGREVVRNLRLDVGVQWRKGWSRPALELTLTSTLPSVRVVSQNVWSPETDVSGTQSAEGSVLWNRGRGRVALTSGRSVGRAGMGGVVFFDRNNNGVRDADEPGVADVVLRVGSRAVTTDSSGRFEAYDLVPFERTVVEIDTLTLPDPTWAALEPRLSVSPAPNSFRMLEVALVQAGVVSGRVQWEGLGPPLGGLRVVFRPERGGATVVANTFSDGGFYVMGLRPGRYTASVSADQVAALGGASASAAFTIGAGDAAQVDGLTIVVTRRAPPQ